MISLFKSKRLAGGAKRAMGFEEKLALARRLQAGGAVLAGMLRVVEEVRADADKAEVLVMVEVDGEKKLYDPTDLTPGRS